MAKLEFLRGADALVTWRLGSGRTRVGRHDSCEVVVPDDDVSRTHCFIDLREGRWVLTDRSRHGTFVDKERVEGPWVLSHGDVLEIGGFRLRFSDEAVPSAERTASHRAVTRAAEQLVSQGDPGVLAVERPVLVVEDGPDAGQRLVLLRPRQFVGAKGSDIALDDPSLVARHLGLQVSLGRAMVLPGRGAAFLEGQRIVDLTPVYPGDVLRLGDTTLSVASEVSEQSDSAESFGAMVGSAEVSRSLFGMLRRVARHPAPVLLIGESGTGKELAARGLHDESPRQAGPFVPVNCGAISENLFESELFGHEKGAFTGASARKDGAFQAAHGGTLFLDEIGELPEASQAKLLRALETGEVRRVGSTSVTHPDVRVVAATNRDLERAVQAGEFRQDLFFRLAVLAIRLPPLRDRLQDLPPLVRTLCHKLGTGVRVTDAAQDKLKLHSWPGNVRELRNVLTRAYVLEGPVIEAAAVRFSPWAFDGPRVAPPTPQDALQGPKDALQVAERRLLEDALARNKGNRSAMARELGLARSTLHYKLARYKLDPSLYM